MKKEFYTQEEITQQQEVAHLAQTLLQNKVKLSVDNFSGERIEKLFKKNQIDLNPWFQRGDVWSNDQQAKLVDSFLSCTPIPAVYLELYKREKGFGYYRVIDGKQRLTSLTQFIENKFSIDYDGQPNDCEWKGKKWSGELELQDIFETRHLSVIILDTTDCSESERDSIEEYVFQRWNDQSSLTQAELRHSIKSELNKLIKEKLLQLTMEKYPVLAKDNKRKAVNEILERLINRLYSGEISHTHPTHRQLMKFHKTDLNDEVLTKIEKEITWALSIIYKNEKITQAKKTISLVMKNDLVILAIDILRKYGKTQAETCLPDFFEHFVNTVVKHKLIIKRGANTPEDVVFMNSVNELFEKYRGGVNGSNKFRHDIWMMMFQKLCDVQKLDSKRLFSKEEKELVWLEQDGKCAMCDESIDIKGAHGDHKHEWILGNQSTLENCQILCPQCHIEKTVEFNAK
jgi:hypothetical protein